MLLSSIAVFAVIVLPGAGASMAAFRPSQVSVQTQLACVFALGYAIAGLWATLLVITGALSAPAFFVGLASITIALWIIGIRKAALTTRASILVRLVKADPWCLGAGAVAVGAVVAVLWNTPAVVNFGVANPFRYWADALEIADAGRIPADTLHWGSAYTPTVSKIVFNSLNAAMSHLGPNPLQIMDPLMKAGVVGVALGAWAMGTELGLRYTAPFVVILSGVVGGLLKQWDLVVGDNYARMVALCGLALGIRALRIKGGWEVPAVAGLCFGAAGGIHLIPTAIALGVFCCYAVAHLGVTRRARETVVATAIILAIFGGIAGANLLFSGGDIGFEVAKDPEQLNTEGGTFDPTRFLATGRLKQQPEEQPKTRVEQNEGWYDRPGDVYETFVQEATGLSSSPLTLVVFPVAAVVIGIVISFAWPRRLRAVGLTAVLFGAALLAGSLLYSFLYDTYVPGRFPQRRLLPYAALPLLLLGLTLLEGAFIVLRRVRPVLPSALAALAVAASLLFFVGGYRWPDATVDRGFVARNEIDWINENLPCNVRLLVGQRTGGTFQALTGRASITEGMAPYLRPTMLADVVDTIREARRFFSRPVAQPQFLEEEDIDYVVLVKDDQLFDENALLRPGNPMKLGNADFLELVHESPTMNVYEVLLSDDPEQPKPADFSGFTCEEGPIPYR